MSEIDGLDVKLSDVGVTSLQAWHRPVLGYWEVVLTAANLRLAIEKGLQYDSWRGRGPTLGAAMLDALHNREIKRNLPPA